MRRALWFLIWSSLLIGLLRPASADRVDDYVKAQMAQAHIPGVSVAVVQAGRVRLMRGYGLASVELNVPATPDTVYELLSITKQFTATAILMLVEDGKLALDDPISRYLPDTPPAWNAITVRHLLTHTSGLTDYTDAPGWFKTIRMRSEDFRLLIPNLLAAPPAVSAHKRRPPQEIPLLDEDAEWEAQPGTVSDLVGSGHIVHADDLAVANVGDVDFTFIIYNDTERPT